MRDYRETRVTSPTWGPLPSCKEALKRLEQAMFITEEADKLYHQVCSLLVMDSWSYMASTFHFAAPETSYEQPLTMTKFPFIFHSSLYFSVLASFSSVF